MRLPTAAAGEALATTEAAQPRLKVLISAYACHPNWGSELGVGWNWSVQAARHHEVWVITLGFMRRGIEEELARGDYPNLHVVYYDLPKWPARFLKVMERSHYVIWEFLVLRFARDLHRKHGFDVVHHLTYNTIEGPGRLWSLGIPFVWGPVGGGQVPPAQLKAYFGRRWPLELVRRFRKEILQFNPFVRSAARKAACILVSNEDTGQRLRRLGGRNLVKEVEAGIASAEPDPAPRDHSGPFTIIWAGGLVARKGPHLALDVAAELKRRGVAFRLLMAGKGYLEDEVRARIAEQDLAPEVEVLGRLPFNEMADLYRRGDIFLFTSLQDTSGNVVLEALSRGLPVVLLDHHGAAEMVEDSCGIKIPVGPPHTVVRDFASAIEKLAGDRDLVQSLSQGAYQHVRDRHTWARKGELLARVYREVVAATPARSDAS